MTDATDNPFPPPVVEVDLAAIADEGMGGDDDVDQPDQGSLPISHPEEGAKVTFVGVAYNDVEGNLQIDDKVAFLVSGEVTLTGKQKMKDGHKRKIVKVETYAVHKYDMAVVEQARDRITELEQRVSDLEKIEAEYEAHLREEREAREAQSADEEPPKEPTAITAGKRSHHRKAVTSGAS